MEINTAKVDYDETKIIKRKKGKHNFTVIRMIENASQVIWYKTVLYIQFSHYYQVKEDIPR